MQLHIYFELHDIDHSILFYLGVDGEKIVSYLVTLWVFIDQVFDDVNWDVIN